MASQAEKQFIIGRPVRIAKALREYLEEAIQAHLTAVEKLTAVLDRADGDADLEPSIATNRAGTGFALVDAEGDEHDGREPDVDDEPSLAFTNDIDQVRAQRHATGTLYVPGSDVWFRHDQDLEVEHDGREDGGEREPEDREV